MATLLVMYEESLPHLCKPLLAQEDTNHNEKTVEFFIKEINYAELEDARSQKIESIAWGFSLASDVQLQR